MPLATDDADEITVLIQTWQNGSWVSKNSPILRLSDACVSILARIHRAQIIFSNVLIRVLKRVFQDPVFYRSLTLGHIKTLKVKIVAVF